MLSPETIATVKATAPVLVEHGETLTRHFYRRMFEGDPAVRSLFNPSHQHSGDQQKALAGAICAYAQNIDKLEALGPAVELIAQKHASLKIRREHYPIVGKHLLASIEEVLGDAATAPIIDAWAEAYGFLADVLIDRESEIYTAHHIEHGWDGFRSFVVDRIETESDCIRSFTLTPQSGGALAAWKPGQYLTVRVPCEETGTTMRNYSISNCPGQGSYRISVKREDASGAEGIAGVVSNFMHDRVQVGDVLDVGPPCGEFFLDVEQAAKSVKPLVFLSGGVGVTPLLSMFSAAQEAELDREMVFVHGALHGGAHAFGNTVRRIAEQHGRSKVHVRYNEPSFDDLETGRCDSEGLIDLPLLRSLLPAGDLDAEYFICGPSAFMRSMLGNLRGAGVPQAQLHFEFFGPQQGTGDEVREAVAS